MSEPQRPATCFQGEVALDVRGLTAAYRRDSGGLVPIVRDLSLTLRTGEILGIAGESGCGKSTAALAVMGYHGNGLVITDGASLLADAGDLTTMSLAERSRVWGRDIVYVPQNAGTALNPAQPVGEQIAEPLRQHLGLDAAGVRERIAEVLDQVQLPVRDGLLKRFPHQFSGGQQQRIALAIALACHPKVLLLDEPTTGLDPTTQAATSKLLRRLVTDKGMAAMYVSHDLSLLSVLADRVGVMYAGELIEISSSRLGTDLPLHPYTQALVRALPSPLVRQRVSGLRGTPPTGRQTDGCSFADRCSHAVDACRERAVPLLEARPGQHVRCLLWDSIEFRPSSDTVISPVLPDRQPVLAVDGIAAGYGSVSVLDDVSFQLRAGETLGVLGESGSGKSTLLRIIAGLHAPTAGEVRLEGSVLHPRAVKRPLGTRKAVQIVFQNPESALNPRHTVEELVSRPLQLFRSDLTKATAPQEIRALLEAVKLPSSVLRRYPSELSGGQKQRVALARAFATRPAVLLCDEVTSSLDVSVQATVIELIRDLSLQHGSGVVFVSHDLGVVRSIADQVLVLRHGVVEEHGTNAQVFGSPTSDYTKELQSVTPALEFAH